MARMRDVARLAGVSTATVSAVVNNKGCVSEKLTKRVKEAMEILDYQPDQVARSLRVGQTHVVGMVVPDVTNTFYTEIMRGVERVAQRAGYSVILCDSDEDPAREQAHLATLYSRRVDGVLLASSISHAAYDRLTQRRFPIVYLDAIPEGITESVLTADNERGGYDATKHLIDLGHRRIAIITGSLNRSVAIDRLEGYRLAMREANLSVPEAFTQRGDFHLDSGYQRCLALMKLSTPPTAIFVCNNRMGLGVMRALGELRVDCPGQVSVVCYDDVDWASSFTPKLTCIAQPTYEMGRQGMEMLLHMLKTLSSPPKSARRRRGIVKLQAELRVRESTAPPPTMVRTSMA